MRQHPNGCRPQRKPAAHYVGSVRTTATPGRGALQLSLGVGIGAGGMVANQAVQKTLSKLPRKTFADQCCILFQPSLKYPLTLG